MKTSRGQLNLEQRMLAKPGRGSDRRTVARDLASSSPRPVGGLVKSGATSEATGVVDDIIAVKVTPELAAGLAKGHGRRQRIWL